MKSTLIPTLILALAPALAYGDDVTDAIENAASSYNSGDLSNAAAQLDYASALVRQLKAEGVTAVFCEPLSGWTADEAESNSAGGMIMGGGVSASRTYTRGEAQVDANLIMDSPMIASMLGMINNPMLITMSGGKLIQVQGNTAMIQSQDGDHTITFVVKSNALFTLQGSYGASKEDVIAYAECLNLGAL